MQRLTCGNLHTDIHKRIQTFLSFVPGDETSPPTAGFCCFCILKNNRNLVVEANRLAAVLSKSRESLHVVKVISSNEVVLFFPVKQNEGSSLC